MARKECVWKVLRHASRRVCGSGLCRGAAPMARLAQSFSFFQGLQNSLSEFHIRNMKTEDLQRAVRMCTAIEMCGSALFSFESAC